MSKDVCEKHIDMLINDLDGSGSDSEWAAVDELRTVLGKDLPLYLLKRFGSCRKWAARCSYVYHAIRYARDCQDAIELGMQALQDKSIKVRYRGCMLLAYSLRKDLLPKLRRIASEIPANSQDDLLATIDAIENENHHYFADRDHSGRVTLNIN